MTELPKNFLELLVYTDQKRRECNIPSSMHPKHEHVRNAHNTMRAYMRFRREAGDICFDEHALLREVYGEDEVIRLHVYASLLHDVPQIVITHCERDL